MLSKLRNYIPAGELLTAMRATVVVAPMLIILAVLSIYIGSLSPSAPPSPPSNCAGMQALLYGMLLGLLGWAVVVLMTKRSVTIHRANPAVYRELYSRFKTAQHQVCVLNQKLEEKYQTKNDPNRSSPPRQDAVADKDDDTFANEGILYAREEVTACLAGLKEVLDDVNLEQQNSKNPRIQDWVEGSGYITTWEQLHRVEEGLILLGPLESVIADGYNDVLRLEGSNIDNRSTLLMHLQDNLKILEARLRKVPIAIPIEKAPQGQKSESTQDSRPPVAVEEVLARQAVRHVRRAINQFRDESRRGLVQARNRLLKTVTMTGLVSFLLMALAVVMCADRKNIVAATAFYLVGAIMGLFNQLYLDGSTEAVTEDYGLATARLIHTLLISGLAALGGVLVIPMLTVLVNTSAAGTATPTAALNLTRLLDLTQQPFSLVLAAIFGLSPVVLISRLQQEAEQYKSDLKGTEAPTSRSSQK
jgi:hypothetical protein